MTLADIDLDASGIRESAERTGLPDAVGSSSRSREEWVVAAAIAGDGIMRPGGLASTKRLVRSKSWRPGSRALDVGCGLGATVSYLRGLGIDAVGVDASHRFVAEARRRFRGIPVLGSEGDRLPFDDASFDAVFAECSLSAMPDTVRALAEWRRVLAPGGALLVSDLYLRDPRFPSRPEESARSEPLSGPSTRVDFEAALAEAGFVPSFWEDSSASLATFVAQLLMRSADPACLAECLNVRPVDAKRLGYFVAKAEAAS